jgi:hypothetical protein
VVRSLRAWEEGVGESVTQLPGISASSTETCTCAHWDKGVIMSLPAWEESDLSLSSRLIGWFLVHIWKKR